MRAPFVPTALAGLGSGAAAAVFSGRSLAAYDGSNGAMPTGSALEGGAASLPLAQALALVALAAWGVILVTRGLLRRLVAGLAACASVGVLLTLVLGRGDLLEAMRQALGDLGIENPEISLTAAYWVALVASLLCGLSAVVAAFAMSSWPEMGRRYDAPGAQRAAQGQPESSTDLWRAMDEGRDPTAGPTP